MPLVPFPAPLPVTDGERVAVWADTAGIRVADDAAPISAARTLRASVCPPGAVSRGRLALDCGDGAIRIRDLASDVESVPAGTTNIKKDLAENQSANGESFFLEGLGARLISIQVFSPKGKGGVSSLRYDLTTGRQIGPYSLRSDEVPALDSADGASKLCGPLRITTHREQDVYSGSIFREPDTFAVAGRRLLIRHGDQIRLYRCGQRSFQVLGRSARMYPLLNDRYAAWATRTTLYVRGFRSGTTRAFALEGAADRTFHTSVVLRGTEGRLWILDAEGVRLLDL